MPSLLLTPCAHPVVRCDQSVADQQCIVAVGDSADHLPIDLGSAVSSAVVRGQRVGEGAARRTEEGWRKGPRGSLGPTCVAGLEVEGTAADDAVRFLGDGRGQSDQGIAGPGISEHHRAAVELAGVSVEGGGPEGVES